MLSAQTTDKKVNEVTPELFRRAPTAQKMSQMEVKDIQNIIAELGLAPTKAKRLKSLSLMLMEEFNGEVPQQEQQLESLPGIGHKTASVVRAQCFGIPSMCVHRIILYVNFHYARLDVIERIEKMNESLKRQPTNTTTTTNNDNDLKLLGQSILISIVSLRGGASPLA